MNQELQLLEEIINLNQDEDPLLKMQLLTEVQYKNQTYPIYSFIIGSPDPTLPTLGLFGGVHGLERVGTQVVLQFLKSFLSELKWNQVLRDSLKYYRIVSIPLINPVGMAHLRRSNGRGVDLMRNAPVDSVPGKKYQIYRGHRISPFLPWFRGFGEMETEARALSYFVEKEMFQSKVALSIDFHSGFGMKDRLWFPYAKTKADFPFVDEAKNISALLNRTHAHHIYHIEPQSDSYTTHGDLWDYLFDRHYETHYKESKNIFIPWTLEMGSWMWLKKNPWQIFKRDGVFNPLVKHRESRTMRRHFVLIDFFSKVVRNPEAWLSTEKLSQSNLLK